MMKRKHGYAPKKIQRLLRQRGITQAQIAKECGVSAMQVSRVVRYQDTGTVSRRIMRAIADKIGVDHRVVFADYFTRPSRRGRRRAA